MTRAICESSSETAVNCLSIVERGLRRLGIDPNAPLTRMAMRTIAGESRSGRYERATATAIQRRGTYQLSEAQVARILELRSQGLSQAQIADEMGCAQGTVAKRLLKNGVRTVKARAEALL